MQYIKPSLSLLVMFLAAVMFFPGCGGNPPLPPEQRDAMYAEAFKAFQEMRGHTNRAIDYPEYVLRLRELDNAIAKLLRERQAGDVEKKKLDYTCAPYRAALEQWNKFSQGQLGPEIADVLPILHEQWELGWERALELKSEITTSTPE